MNETLKRALSGLVYIVLLIFATHFSKTTFFVLFGLFMLQTVREFCDLINLPKTQSLLVSGFLFLLFGCFLPGNKFTDLGLALASLFVSIKLMLWLFTDSKNITDNQGKWVNLIGYIILPFIFIAKIGNFNGNFNPSLIIGIFMIIWTNDTFAYIVGKSIGKHKLFEKISPKKTIEGFFGGLFFSVLIGVIIAKYYFENGIVYWTITAIIVSAFGTVGDLVESKFKRVANVKDSGNIMPGHGGLLDRLDSIIFVSPFLFLFYKIIHHVS